MVGSLQNAWSEESGNRSLNVFGEPSTVWTGKPDICGTNVSYVSKRLMLRHTLNIAKMLRKEQISSDIVGHFPARCESIHP